MKSLQKKLSLHVIFTILFGLNVNAQSDTSLLTDLNQTLFFQNNEQVSIMTFQDCMDSKKDTSYLIRKNQPPLPSVINSLRKIALTKNNELLPDLIYIYEKQIEFYKKEWQPVHEKHIYACDIANEQYQILEAFEATIHSLKFGSYNISGKEKYEYFKKDLFQIYRYYHERGKSKDALKNFNIHSQYYRIIREKRWIGPPGNHIHFIEPYIDDIEEHAIKDILSYLNQEIPDTLTPPFEEFLFGSFCSFASKNNKSEISLKLLELNLKHTPEKRRYLKANFLRLIRNEKFRPYAKAALFEKKGNENNLITENALKCLIYFPGDLDVVIFYKKTLRKKTWSKKEKEIILENLNYHAEYRHASDKVKSQAKKLIKKYKG